MNFQVNKRSDQFSSREQKSIEGSIKEEIGYICKDGNFWPPVYSYMYVCNIFE